MFEKYFVTCPVAVALRAAGFDEPCMASWEHYDHTRSLTAFEEPNIMRINYTNSVLDPRIYNEELQRVMKERPNLFAQKLQNSQLPAYLYAAPLYGQVLEWLHGQGIRVHENYLTTGERKIATKLAWAVRLVDTKTGKTLWPDTKIAFSKEGIFEIIEPDNEFEVQRDAWEQSILAAIKLLPNESKVDV